MDKLKPPNLAIVISGAVMLIASFLPFTDIGSHSNSAWSKYYFLIATIPALIGVAMAVQVALVAYAPQVKMPEKVFGFTWTQVHLVLGFQATIMMLAFLLQDTGGPDKGIGLYLMLLASIGLFSGAVLRMQEQKNPTT
jgi:tryptophan-rich sensory protein